MAGTPRRRDPGQAYCTHRPGREAVEREPRLASEVDREAGRRTHGDEAADAGGDGLLDELEACPATDHEAGGAGVAPARTRVPITLSTALWRPTSSRTTSMTSVGGRPARPRARRRCARRAAGPRAAGPGAAGRPRGRGPRRSTSHRARRRAPPRRCPCRRPRTPTTRRLRASWRCAAAMSVPAATVMVTTLNSCSGVEIGVGAVGHLTDRPEGAPVTHPPQSPPRARSRARGSAS